VLPDTDSVSIGDGRHLGAQCVVAAGSSIGDQCVIGANSFVKAIS
jgi:acetyltransferase-like isoleucine patch superfamily enzyme